MVHCAPIEDATDTVYSTGYEFETIASKLDHLQDKVLELDQRTKDHIEEIALNQSRLESFYQSLQWSINQQSQATAHNLTILQDQSQKILTQRITCANDGQMRDEIARPAPNSAVSVTSQTCFELCSANKKGPYRTCKDEPTKVSGLYLLQPRDTDEPFVAFCEQSKFGGGWLVFQNRFDGSLHFNRTWKQYRNEFGRVGREYWIGLDRLHLLTSGRTVELLVEMEDFVGNHGYARYNEFVIGTESEQYTLKKLGKYRGTAGDSLTRHKNMKFATFDRDNMSKCGVRFGGGWWYLKCHPSNLHGYYQNKMDWAGIIWHSFQNSTQGLAYTRMMIREV